MHDPLAKRCIVSYALKFLRIIFFFYWIDSLSTHHYNAEKSKALDYQNLVQALHNIKRVYFYNIFVA